MCILINMKWIWLHFLMCHSSSRHGQSFRKYPRFPERRTEKTCVSGRETSYSGTLISAVCENPVVLQFPFLFAQRNEAHASKEVAWAQGILEKLRMCCLHQRWQSVECLSWMGGMICKQRSPNSMWAPAGYFREKLANWNQVTRTESYSKGWFSAREF